MAGHVSGNQTSSVKYVYELPYTERKMLCNILDMDNQWERLGGQFMQFKVHELYEMRRVEKCGESPCDRLLQIWGHQNNTIAHLYFLLYKMHHYQAMRVLLPFIPPKHHALALQGEQSLTEALPSQPSSPAFLYGSPHSSGGAAASSLETDALLNESHKQAIAASLNTLPKPPSHLLTSKHPSEIGANGIAEHHGAQQTSPAETESANLPYCDNLNTEVQSVPEQCKNKVPPEMLRSTPAAPTTKIVNTDFTFSPCAGVSCEENITAPSGSRPPPREGFDTEYREKVNAKFGQLSIAVTEAAESATAGGSGGDKVTVVAAGDVPSSSTSPSPGALCLPSPSSPRPRNRQPSTVSEVSVLSDCNAGPSVPVISYAELTAATGEWRQENLLGRGGFGSVYRATWKNTEVAVKRIHPPGESALGTVPLYSSQTAEELRHLQAYRHDNILQIYGCSADPGRPACLVYQFMINGSVEDKLQRRLMRYNCAGLSGFELTYRWMLGGSVTNRYSKRLPRGDSSSPVGLLQRQPSFLDWSHRLNIARGTAKALQYLHTVNEKPLIHGDIKSANILLDCNLEPKLGDFGLAREGPMSQYTSMEVSSVHGTKPYLPEEYLRNKKLSTKVDCYSYGVVLFELCTGLRAYDEKLQPKLLKELVCNSREPEALQDPKAGYDVVKVFPVLLQLGKECVVRAAKKRPDMAGVYARLQAIARHEQRSSQGSLPSLHSSLYSPGSVPMPSITPSNPPTPHPTTTPFPPIHPTSSHPSMPSSIPTHVLGGFSSNQSPQQLYQLNPHRTHSPVGEAGQYLDQRPAMHAANNNDNLHNHYMLQNPTNFHHNITHLQHAAMNGTRFNSPQHLRPTQPHSFTRTSAMPHQQPSQPSSQFQHQYYGIGPSGAFNMHQQPIPYHQHQLQNATRATAPQINVSPPSQSDAAGNNAYDIYSTAAAARHQCSVFSQPESTLSKNSAISLQQSVSTAQNAVLAQGRGDTSIGMNFADHLMGATTSSETRPIYSSNIAPSQQCRYVNAQQESIHYQLATHQGDNSAHNYYPSNSVSVRSKPGFGSPQQQGLIYAQRQRLYNQQLQYNNNNNHQQVTNLPMMLNNQQIYNQQQFNRQQAVMDPLVVNHPAEPVTQTNNISVPEFECHSITETDSEAMLPILTVLGNKNESTRDVTIDTKSEAGTREVSSGSSQDDDSDSSDEVVPASCTVSAKGKASLFD